MPTARPVIAVADANVLMSGIDTHLLLGMAINDLIDLRWSEFIEAEAWNGLVHKRKKPKTPAKADEYFARLHRALPYALVTVRAGDTVPVSGIPDAPDRDDLHIAAAAVAAGADVIITKNLHDYPTSVQKAAGALVKHTDEVLVAMMTARPTEMRRVLDDVVDLEGWLTWADLPKRLRDAGCQRTADFVERWAEVRPIQ